MPAQRMSTTTLIVKERPHVPLEAELLSPDVIATLSHAELCALPVALGKRQCRLDDFFTIDGAGTCTVEADQSGDSTYAAAASVDQSFSVTAGVASISVTNIPSAGSALVGSNFAPSYAYDGNGTTSVTSSSPSICGDGRSSRPPRPRVEPTGSTSASSSPTNATTTS